MSQAGAAAFRRNIARAVLAMPSLPSVARALAAGIPKPELAPVVDQHLQLLFRQSERFVSRLVDGRGWRVRRPLDVEARTFWSTALGAVLLVRAGAHGTVADLDLAGALTIHDESEPGWLGRSGPRRRRARFPCDGDLVAVGMSAVAEANSAQPTLHRPHVQVICLLMRSCGRTWMAWHSRSVDRRNKPSGRAPRQARMGSVGDSFDNAPKRPALDDALTRLEEDAPHAHRFASPPMVGVRFCLTTEENP
ncbi:TetR/AcrR family transcriptional regulator C-terminal domain-containing protein [Streptomyces spiralis]